jgi:hypothetical protein
MKPNDYLRKETRFKWYFFLIAGFVFMAFSDLFFLINYFIEKGKDFGYSTPHPSFNLCIGLAYISGFLLLIWGSNRFKRLWLGLGVILSHIVLFGLPMFWVTRMSFMQGEYMPDFRFFSLIFIWLKISTGLLFLGLLINTIRYFSSLIKRTYMFS